MNRAESERLGSLFEQRGYQPTTTLEEADIIVLNSCVVRQSAESRVINQLYRLRAWKETRAKAILALTGCLVSSESKALKRKFPHIDYFFKSGEYPPWLGKAANVIPLPNQPCPCTYVPIIQGCDNFCSFCIVPYRRGRERSRPVYEIVAEIKELVSRGTKEAILLGQNVDSYGHDLPDRPNLSILLYKLNDIEKLARIRFLTNHPKDMSHKLIRAIAELDKVCHQINLPVQSGDNEILAAMKRGYTAGDYRRLVERIRQWIPDMALSTDVIVGFPSESDIQFHATLELLGELRFDSIHIAAYSPRQGTAAAMDYPDDVPTEVKKARLAIIEKQQVRIATEINNHLVNKTLEVLVEGYQKGKWHGRSRSGKLVFFSVNNNLLGKLVEVKIIKASPWSLQGKVIKDLE
jgi:tRNA-2-methylthio-N6-dimethylallyladenosine synthase